MISGIQQCTRCLLDSSDDPGITFNESGVCSLCQHYDLHNAENTKTVRELDTLVARIKKAGEGLAYDCIIGLSGGVDSTFLALKAKELGLRPLAVHFDNGWNSELAVGNIESIINRLGFDLRTFVIDWEEFRDLQRAFIRASVVDIEMITDHAIIASVYKIALENKIRFILNGVNYVTESIMPPSWIHNKRDHVHIRAINRQFGTRPLDKFPLLNSRLNLRIAWSGIESVSILNYIPYIKSEVKKEISEKLGWRDYGGKHYESVFTRFYQGYILPVKFHIDKRKAHLSNLICSGQITKADALLEISEPAYPDDLKRIDYDFVLKKLGFSREQFDLLMKAPPKRHEDYPVDTDIYTRFPFLRILRPAWHVVKGLKNKI
jgi:N-acetyl sugar amidotransferase